MSAISLMTHRCTIKRSAPTNVNGVMQANWAAVATNVKCLIQEKAGTINIGPAGAALAYDATCFLPPATDIKPRGTSDNPDQLTQTTPATNAIYLVQHVADRSGFANHLTAYLKRLSAQ